MNKVYYLDKKESIVKKFIQIVCLLTPLSPLTLVGFKKAQAEEIETLKLGVMPSTDNIPLLVAIQQGFDKKHGVDLELEVFATQMTETQLFKQSKWME